MTQEELEQQRLEVAKMYEEYIKTYDVLRKQYELAMIQADRVLYQPAEYLTRERKVYEPKDERNT